MKVSIIIPVFKVEDYLAACLDSILAQGFGPDEFEVIIINDGSPDNSKAIALDYTSKHPNFIFIDQENQGVSVARSAGLDKASGDYISFIDPDDTIYPDSLKPIVERAYKDNLDVLYLSLDVFDETGNLLHPVEQCGDDNVIDDGFTHPRRTYLSTLYKRAAIGNIRFKTGIIRGQDTVFNIMVQAMAKRCSNCSIPYYKYLQRGNSSRQFVGTNRNFVSSLLAIATIDDFRKTHFPEQTPQQKAYFDNAILIFIQRVLEWNIFPHKSKTNFDALKARLQELQLGYLIGTAARKFPMFDRSYGVFMGYRKLNGLYHALLHKFAKK
jgi:glycosyltransferase involved in cell wall biosynthesis